MKAALALALATALCIGSAGAAQLYRWVDEQGRVEWRDTPPPAGAKNVEQRTLGANTIETSGHSFAMQQAMKNHPVTLWVSDCGEPCTRARAHLARRGVPHSARDAQKEWEALKKATGALEVPVLTVGATQLKGYAETTWDTALDAAGYPRSAPAAPPARGQTPK